MTCLVNPWLGSIYFCKIYFESNSSIPIPPYADAINNGHAFSLSNIIAK